MSQTVWQSLIGSLASRPVIPFEVPCENRSTQSINNTKKGLETERCVLLFMDEPKTIKQVMERTGMTKAGAGQCMARLRQKGLVRKVGQLGRDNLWVRTTDAERSQ